MNAAEQAVADMQKIAEAAASLSATNLTQQQINGLMKIAEGTKAALEGLQTIAAGMSTFMGIPLDVARRLGGAK